MVIGAYYLTELVDGRQGRGPRLPPPRGRCYRALDEGALSLHALDHAGRPPATPTARRERAHDDGRPRAVRGGAAGRLHRAASATSTAVDTQARHGRCSSSAWPRTTQGRGRRGPRRHQEPLLPLRRPVGPHHLDRRRQDARPRRRSILDRYEKEADKVETQFRRGIITDGERRQQEVAHLDRGHRRRSARRWRRRSRPSSSTPST